jgi:hypothetical protein
MLSLARIAAKTKSLVVFKKFEHLGGCSGINFGHRKLAKD